jgi:hypothetical protein
VVLEGEPCVRVDDLDVRAARGPRERGAQRGVAIDQRLVGALERVDLQAERRHHAEHDVEAELGVGLEAADQIGLLG